jgi:hypothetical protein
VPLPTFTAVISKLDCWAKHNWNQAKRTIWRVLTVLGNLRKSSYQKSTIYCSLYCQPRSCRSRPCLFYCQPDRVESTTSSLSRSDRYLSLNRHYCLPCSVMRTRRSACDYSPLWRSTSPSWSWLRLMMRPHSSISCACRFCIDKTCRFVVLWHVRYDVFD